MDILYDLSNVNDESMISSIVYTIARYTFTVTMKCFFIDTN